MVVIRRASEADFLFTANEYDGEFRVLRFNGIEAISEPFRYSLRLATQDSEIDFDTIVGKEALLSIYGEVGERYVHGIVSKLTQGGTGNRYTIYNLELVPSIWLLSMRYDCRIFQDMNVQDIIDQVLSDASIVSDSYRFELNGTHPTREYCVQYRETDLNFIFRLMEEEGIFYFFEHSENGHVMVISDNASVFTPIEPTDSSTIVFNDASGMVADQESIYEYRFSQQIMSSTVSLQDFNFEQPASGMSAMALSGEESPDYEGDLEIYDYPGEYSDQDIGSDLAQIRLEALRTNRRIGFGQSSCRRLIPGYKFTLDRHTRSDLNQEYLITRVTTSATQPLGEDSSEEGSSYNNDFECIPSLIPFRPPRKSLKPVVEGVQTAMVVGPNGEEIYTDEHSRVKVQFHWDRDGQHDENSSCWIRVSQGWAGTGWGIIFIPRIGQEVIVDFLEGDPDRPIITGRVYNGDNTPPYALPDDKTKSTIKSDSSLGGGGSNEIRFEDSKGNEEVYIHAQKNMNQVIENNMSTSVGANQSTSVGNDQTINVSHNRTKTIDNDQSETIGNDKTIDVGNNHSETIGNDKELQVGNNHTETINNNMSITIASNLSESVGSNYVETVGKNMELSVGIDKTDIIAGNMLSSVGSNLTVTVGGNSQHTASSNLSLQAGSNMTVVANSEMQISAQKITISGAQEITIGVGPSSIKIKPDGVQISGPKVSTTAVGINEISGALIKLN